MLSYESSCSCNSYIRKTFSTLYQVHGAFSGSLLAQHNDQGHELVIYYMTRSMIKTEHRYNPVKKECLTLVFADPKKQHYLVGQTMQVISKINPLRLLMTKLFVVNGRLAKWAILFLQYEMRFLPQKAIKGQTLADFRAINPIEGDETL